MNKVTGLSSRQQIALRISQRALTESVENILRPGSAAVAAWQKNISHLPSGLPCLD